MDLAYLRAHPHVVPMMVRHQRIRATPLPGGDTCAAELFTLDGGEALFAKSREGAPQGFFAAEAAGLSWIAEAGVIPTPEVIAVSGDLLLLEWVPRGEPSPEAAERFGTELARLHLAGAEDFGAPWPGFIGRLPMDNQPAASGTWSEFFAVRRVEPYLRAAREAGHIEPEDADSVSALLSRLDSVGSPPEPPARLHGDLWSGNVHWSAAGPAYVIDPAAHGGHRESDLAMLALFGVPFLDRIIAAYDEVAPLGSGWQERTALHQLFPVLVHAVMFGGSYGRQAGALARRYL
ncbi:MAG: fructosamine kinase family protein [Geodermatophilaceae bacterium]|nr:fructosamine kinase family protein [Geodermatophilaceae bacterium]